jgi:hypothetical protein
MPASDLEASLSRPVDDSGRASGAPRPGSRVSQGQARGQTRVLTSASGRGAGQTARWVGTGSTLAHQGMLAPHCPRWSTRRPHSLAWPMEHDQRGARDAPLRGDNQVVGLILAPRGRRLLRHQTEDRTLTRRPFAMEAALPFGPHPCEPGTSRRGSCRCSHVCSPRSRVAGLARRPRWLGISPPSAFNACSPLARPAPLEKQPAPALLDRPAEGLVVLARGPRLTRTARSPRAV